MRKRDELTDPASCMSRARDSEMTFVLLGRDAAVPATIRFWIAERVRLGRNRPDDPQIVEAERCARTMEAERDRPDGKQHPAYEARTEAARPRAALAGDVIFRVLDDMKREHIRDGTYPQGTGIFADIEARYRRAAGLGAAGEGTSS